MGVIRFSVGFAALTVLSVATQAGAQQCAPSARPYFDFQVERPAEFLLDSTIAPRPVISLAEGREPQRVVVQFVVDTLGVPDTASFKVLISSDTALEAAGRRALRVWRYRPAVVGGCPVAQLIQTALRPEL